MADCNDMDRTVESGVTCACSLRAGVRIAFIVILVFGFAVRLYKICDPPLDYHPTRQYISANIAKGMYLSHHGSAPEWQRQVARLNANAEMRLEPRYTETVVTGLYILTGGERLWLARLLGAFVWVLGAIPLTLLGTRFLRSWWVLVPPVVYLFLPFSIIGSQVFQPEPLMITAMVSSFLLIVRYFERTTWQRLFAAALVSSFAISAKPVCIFFVVLAFVSLAFARHGIIGSLRQKQYWVFGLVAVLPSLVYYLHAMSGTTDLNSQSVRSFLPGLILTLRYWLGWTDRMGRVVGLLPCLVGLIGILTCRKREQQHFLGGLYLAYLVYGLVFTHHIHTHDYYSLPFIPVVALCLPLGLLALGSWCRQVFGGRGGRHMVMAAVLLCIILPALAAGSSVALKGPRATCHFALKYGGGFIGLHKKFVLFLLPGRSKVLHEHVRVMEEMGVALNHNTNTACLSDDYGKSLFYHAEIAGPFLFPNASVDGLTEQCLRAAETADYVVVRLYESAEKQRQLRGRLEQVMPVVFAQGDCLAFDAKRKRQEMDGGEG